MYVLHCCMYCMCCLYCMFCTYCMCRICCFKETLFEGSRLEEMLLDTSDCCILAGEFTHALRHTFVMPWGPAKFPTLPQTIPYIQPNAIC